MAFILNIETATTVCSVSISHNEKNTGVIELNNGYTHAEHLHVYIEQAFKLAGITAKQLHAIAVSKGPGSYTGLRIGASAAKGMAYALNIPLIAVETLQVMAAAAKNSSDFEFYCPMIDARRMEVYTSVYDQSLKQQQPTEALVVDENSIRKFGAYSNVCFFGNGMPKCKSLLQSLPNAIFMEDIFPSSKFMAGLSYQKYLAKAFEDTAYFEPGYLKEFFTNAKKT